MIQKKEIINSLKRGFFLRKTAKIMFNIEDMNNVVDVKEKSKSSYSYSSTKIREFERMGLVNTIESGRTTKIVITERGKKLRDNLVHVQGIVNRIRKDMERKLKEEKQKEIEE